MKLFKKNLSWDLVFIVVYLMIWAFIVHKNYVPGTWLTGWDNVHPEFNFGLSLRRALNGVWQENWGLGILAGMAHMADLPRIIILWIFSLIFPANVLRYAWTFLMLLIGPIGTYFLISRVFTTGKRLINRKLAGFAAGSFYLLNLATVQYFFTPFETFVSFYGFLPWLLLVALRYLKQDGNKNLFLVFIVSVLATPAFFVQTLFVVFVMILGVFVIEDLIRSRLSKLLQVMKLGIVIFFANAFWLMPVGYFSLTNAEVVTEAKINVISTPETQLFNEATGSLEEISLIKGFWFNYTDLQINEEFGYLLDSWRNYFDQQYVEEVGLALFGIAVFGLVMSAINKKSKWGISSLILFLVGFMMLGTNNPPLGWIFNFLSDNVPLFSEFFRSAFTKWSVAFALILSIGLGSFVFFLGGLLENKVKYLTFLPVLGVLLGSMFTIKPVFEGKLMMDPGRIEIPQEYFELFDYFDSQPQQRRVALFPIHQFWGWNFYDWGYRGSGILWSGLKQPLLDRPFDVWSPNNESFYWEAERAISSNDSSNLERVLDKYNVSYVIIDESIFVPEQEQTILKIQESKELLTEIGFSEIFKSGKLSVYANEDSVNEFVYSPEQYFLNASEIRKVKEDVANSIGDYVSLSSDTSVQFPLWTLLNEKVADISWEEVDENSSWADIDVSNNLVNFESKYLTVPPLNKGDEIVFPTTIILEGDQLIVSFKRIVETNFTEDIPTLPSLLLTTPEIIENGYVSIDEDNVFYIQQGERIITDVKLVVGESIEVNLFDADEIQSFDLDKEFLSQEMSRCWVREGEEGVMKQSYPGNGIVNAEVQDAVGCLTFQLGTIDSIDKALLRISQPYRSYDGSRPHFCVLEEGDDSFTCRNREVFYDSYPSEKWTEVEREMTLDSSKRYWLQVAAKPPDAKGRKWSIDYKPPTVSGYPISAWYTFDQDVWEDLQTANNIKIAENFDESTLNFRIYAYKRLHDFSIGGRRVAENCDVMDRGLAERFLYGNGVLYTANEGGSSCDLMSLNSLSTKNSYIFRFRGENRSGRSSKIYLFNRSTNRNDIEALLPEGMFDTNLTTYGWSRIPEDYYVLNLETRSFGKRSENIIDQVYSYQLPIQWLSVWRIGNEDFDMNQNDIKINNSNRLSNYRYDVQTTGEGLLTLSQGYNVGWRAYSVDGRLQQLVPFLFADKLDHVKVNGWANGWLVEQTRNREQGTGNNAVANTNHQSPITSHIIIIYWPQYLEFFGLALIPLTLIYFTVIFIRSRKSDTPDSKLKKKVLE